MLLTKYEHACFVVEKDGKLLVVDPGAFTTDLPALESVVGVVVTHEHADHFDSTALGAIIAHNPDAAIYAHQDITRQLGDTLPHQAVKAGETVAAGPFKLEFFGGEHAVIHPDIPVVANLGVMINDQLYYPGDSFTLPDRPVDTLALPTAAPWMKMSEAFDFLMAVKPRLAFPTHDAVASDAGKSLADRMTPMFAEKVGATYQRIESPIEIDG
jgi:L-ascorbate metabolism protein UlaG (beta-lactamase superfamily)